MSDDVPQSADVELLRRIRRLAITGLFTDEALFDILVLKGGNLLDEVYGISPRTSIDVDVSMDGDFIGTSEELRERIERGLTSAFDDAGYVVFDVKLREVPPSLSDDMRSFWGGYKVDFKIIAAELYRKYEGDIETLRRNSLSVGKKGSTRFQIDISKHEYCAAKARTEIDGYTIYAYTPPMFVCEKLRAICQQMPEYSRAVWSNPSARARDFLDIHIVAEHYSIDFASIEFREMLRLTFEAKRVPLVLLEGISKPLEA